MKKYLVLGMLLLAHSASAFSILRIDCSRAGQLQVELENDTPIRGVFLRIEGVSVIGVACSDRIPTWYCDTNLNNVIALDFMATTPIPPGVGPIFDLAIQGCGPTSISLAMVANAFNEGEITALENSQCKCQSPRRLGYRRLR